STLWKTPRVARLSFACHALPSTVIMQGGSNTFPTFPASPRLPAMPAIHPPFSPSGHETGMAPFSAKKIPHPVQCLAKLRLARGVGKPNIAGTVLTEAFARHQRHMCLLEKIAGELARRPPGALHTGKGIEG